VFEIRFQTKLSAAASVLLGVFFNKHKNVKIEKLSVSDIPQQIRDSDIALRHAPLFRIALDKYSILIGDRVFAVTTSLPYQGWIDFKETIVKFVNEIKQADIITVIERYSLKYVDLIEADSTKEQLALIELGLKLGSFEIMNEAVNLRLEILQDNIINVVQIVSNGIVENSNGQKKKGIIINIDSISNGPYENFWNSLPENLEKIHALGKKFFFDFLKESTIKLLGPVYE
jgi:uncharacterized protein (TIGR04255 family)